MKCPYCGEDEDKVVDTRSRDDGKAIRRRRQCLKCERRFITIEIVEDKTISVIKSDNRHEPFDAQKIIRGIQIACIKRPVSIDQIEKLVLRVEAEIRSGFQKEIESRIIGELVSKYLRELDEIAYVRFASVYRKFEDKAEFEKELKQLKDTNKNKN